MLSVPENLPSIEDGEPPHLQPKKGWGWGLWSIVAVIVVLEIGLLIPARHSVSAMAPIIVAQNHCRQIVIELKAYASDHGSKYPEGATSNDVFRELIKGGQLEDERIFSSPGSPYVGDNNVGDPPGYAQALQARENHWAMTKGLTGQDYGNTPLVFENPAVCSWPPLWLGGQHAAVPGRTWSSKKLVNRNRIVVGRTDGSVNTERLQDGDGKVTLECGTNGKNLFELAGPHEVLDVAK